MYECAVTGDGCSGNFKCNYNYVVDVVCLPCCNFSGETDDYEESAMASADDQRENDFQVL